MKISIIIPSFKGENFIYDILDDIEKQTYTNWELIIVGNGSCQDLQRKIVEKNFRKDHRIRYVSIKEQGASRARNRGIKEACGDWITFVDVDDRVSSNFLQSFITHTSKLPDIIIGGMTYKNMYTRSIHYADIEIGCNVYYTQCINQFLKIFFNDMAAMCSPCSKFYKATFLKNLHVRFKEDFSICEDVIFNFQLALKCNSMTFFNRSGYVYCLHPQTSSVGRYHPCLEQAEATRRDLMYQVMKRGGFSEMEIDYKMASMHAGDALDTILNLYRVGSPFGFWGKRKQLQRVYSDPKLINAWKVFNPPMSNIPLVLFRIFHALRAPMFCLATFHLLFAVRNLWRKINEAVRFS